MRGNNKEKGKRKRGGKEIVLCKAATPEFAGEKSGQVRIAVLCNCIPTYALKTYSKSVVLSRFHR